MIEGAFKKEAVSVELTLLSKGLSSDNVMIHDEIYFEEDLTESDPSAVFYSELTELFYAVSIETSTVRRFKLSEPFDVIATKHRDKILDYSLSHFMASDKVRMIDIFMQSEYITEIK